MGKMHYIFGAIVLLFMVFSTNCGPIENHPPVIVNDKIAVSPSIVKTGSKVVLTVVRVEDPDNDPITYVWETHRGKVPEGPRAESMIDYVAPNEPGDDVVKVTVSDGQGGVDEAVITIHVVCSGTPTPTPTNTPVPPTDTPVSPTDTPGPSRETLVSPTDTPVPLTDTPVPPTDTPTPTDTPIAVESLTGKIAFPIYKGKQKNIYLAELDGVEPTLKRLTRDASEPALSPDGSQIALRSWNASTRGLIVMNVNGTHPCRVSRALEDASPCWAQGESLVFHSTKEGPTPRLYTVGTWEGVETVDSVQDVMRGTEPAYGQYPAWVPDGRIVYTYFERSGNFLGLYIMNLDGSNPMPITEHPGDTMPSVSPRGDKVTFMSDRTGKWEVYVVNIDGSGLRQLTDSGGYNSGLPTWSPDGNFIAFVSDRGNKWAAWVIKSDGSGERKLFDLDGTLNWGERISWAP